MLTYGNERAVLIVGARLWKPIDEDHAALNQSTRGRLEVFAGVGGVVSSAGDAWNADHGSSSGFNERVCAGRVRTQLLKLNTVPVDLYMRWG